jgi:hypothetical protein
MPRFRNDRTHLHSAELIDWVQRSLPIKNKTLTPNLSKHRKFVSRHSPFAQRMIAWPAIYHLAGLARGRLRRRNPGPPPFSSMNSTPAASKACRTARSLAAVIEVSTSASSTRRVTSPFKRLVVPLCV